MRRCKKISELRGAVRANRDKGAHITFVPTMGNLHAGHISLVQRAKQISDVVVVSIFVNPLQFGPNEDLANYPRTLEQDQAKLQQAGTSLLFIPSVEEIYPEGQSAQTTVSVPLLGDMLCGSRRPGHFDGVSTIVSKLFNIVQPDTAVFGEKDFQQLAILRKMVIDMSIPVGIVGMPIIRESDGLAMSSRNRYLSTDDRLLAPNLQAVLLQTVERCLREGNSATAVKQVIVHATKALNESGFKVDYIDILDARNLRPPEANTQEAVLFAAAYLGKTRLIDNIQFSY